MYTFHIELEDGTKGTINSKSSEPKFLDVGEELTYTSEETKYGTKLKRVSEPKIYGGKSDKFRVSSMAMSYAKDFAISKELKSSEMFELAEKIYDWINARP